MHDSTNNQQPITNKSSDIRPEIKAHPDLYKKTIRGGFWLVLERIIQQSLSLVRLIVLGWLLPPREFGVLGIAMLLLQIFETFTQTGFSTALIQKKEEDINPYLNTAWTVNILRGICLFVVFSAAAPLVIPFFDGDGTFRPADILKPAQLARELTNKGNPGAVYLMGLMPESSRSQITQIALLPEPSPQGQELLSEELNGLIKTADVASSGVLKDLKLSPYARHLAASVTPETLPRANRMIFQQIWPDMIQHTVLDRWQLTSIIRVIAIVLLFRAFGSTAILYFTKNLRFEKMFVLHVCATAVNVTASVILAFMLRSVWALVWGLLLAEAMTLIMSYVMHPWRPGFAADFAKLAPMWRFGRWITGLSVLELMLNMGDSVLVGRFLGTSSLGMYQTANRLSALPITEFTSVIARATFPAFSKIQSDIVRLRDAFLKAVDVASVFVMPAVGAVIVFSDDIVKLFMQDTWLPMVSILKILAITGFFRTIPAGSLFHSVGKPSWLTILIGIRVALIAVLFYPLINAYGVNGMAWAVTVSGLIMMIPGYILMTRILELKFTVFLQRQAAQAIGAAAMMALVLCIKQWVWTNTTYERFFVLALLSAIVYWSICILLTKTFKAQWLSFFVERYYQARKFAADRI